MKITNDTETAREYPALAIVLQPGESFDDTKQPTKASAPTIPAPSSEKATDSTENEVK